MNSRRLRRGWPGQRNFCRRPRVGAQRNIRKAAAIITATATATTSGKQTDDEEEQEISSVTRRCQSHWQPPPNSLSKQ
jgi:sigma54-dependent transcription regulator